MAMQQDEARQYFDTAAEDWRRKAESRTGAPAVNVIAQRNETVLRRVRTREPGVLLDIGCGTGELVIDAAAAGWTGVGIDFAPEMVRLAEEKRVARGIEGARFVQTSFFDYEAEPGSFDLIAAMGFIEYISPDELTAMLRRCRRLLRPGGGLLVGSRNRLYNCFSLSAYTEMERALGTVDRLLGEAVLLAGEASLEVALRRLSELQPVEPKPTEHPQTNIGVRVRHQYTPAELARLLRDAGLETVGLHPIHYQALPVPASKDYREAYVGVADALHALAPEEHRLVPFCSSFVVEAR